MTSDATSTERERIVLRPPPVSESGGAGSGVAAALPVLGSLGSIGLFATMAGGHRQYAAVALVVATAVLAALGQLDRQRQQQRRAREAVRHDYLAHLAEVRAHARAVADRQRLAAVRRHPPPAALAALAAASAPSWSAAVGPAGGRWVRYGTAPRPLDADLPDPEVAAHADPFCTAAATRLAATHRVVPALPAVVDLAAAASLAAPAGAARAIVCAASTDPDTVVAVLAAPGAAAAWEWVKWLPGCRGERDDLVGARRLVGGTWPELAALVPTAGHLLLVVDGLPPPAPERHRTTVLTVGDELLLDGRPLPGSPDTCSVAAAEAYARRSARPVPGPAGAGSGDRLAVVLGTGDDGGPVVLDLEEAARGGHGPHGMVIGATGSGKSELLRSLVLQLALARSPADLNLVLVDFKGGTAFDGLAELPHVAALVTNLADEEDLLDRMQDALTSELVRRQALLRAAGVAHAAALPGLPSLLVVVDEFAELVAARPELDELFGTIGRLGRGLGIHLLLASQRLDEGRWRGLESHLAFRIGLRTFTAHESRAVLGVPDAYELPATPGLGYLRTDPWTLRRFRATYVGAPVRHPPQLGGVLPFTAAPVGEAPDRGPVRTVAEEAVERLRGAGPPAHRIWLPPLDRSATLGGLLPGIAADAERGLGVRAAAVPLGEVDRPRAQRRDVLAVDLTMAGLGVVGAPGSGRTTLLQTAVAGLALTRTPREATVHLFDLRGGLAPLAGLPHVASVVGPADVDLAGLVLRRAADGATVVVDDWPTLRRVLGPDLEDDLVGMVVRGRVRLVVAALRWSDLRPALRDALTTRIELRLGDPLDSELDRRLAATVPRGRPGRGLVDGAHFLAALPTLGPGGDLADLVARVGRAWSADPVPRLRSLPTDVALAGLPRTDAVRVGVREGDQEVVTLPASGHLVVLGDGGSGRTTLLRTVASEVVRVGTPDRAQLLLLDPRGGLAGVVPADRLLAHVTVDDAAAVGELAGHLARRLSGSRGPDVWVIADDAELLETPALQPLVPLLPRSRETGLHLVVARRTGGAGRALYEPVLGTLRDLRSPGVLLPGGAEEGPLLAGVRARGGPPGRAQWIDPNGRVTLVQIARL